MNAKTEVQESRMDTLKLVVVVALLLAGVAGFYYFADQMLLLRVLGLLVMAGLALAVGLQTGKGRALAGFVVDARNEVRKVVWPTRAETVQTSLAVFAVVIVVGIMLWLFDMFLLWAVRFLTGQGG
ncbi:MAG: preprotein translocase subunit SecE [Gammaproteobacteria bacterium]|nr:preprotein translocase subunit SecE [Gammaproteobacteria bacterium]MCW9059744.1 preprotein translocase subunit SecE [Gammaproteobacteria bacterium]